MPVRAAAEFSCLRQQGFGMVEVLVTVLLLSIGLLGLASLQTLSVKRANSSAQRIEALNLSYDLLDRMRINRAQAIGGRYNIAFGDSAAGDEIAEADLQDWKMALSEALPDGDGQVLVESERVTISVRWTETLRTDANGGDGRLNLVTQL